MTFSHSKPFLIILSLISIILMTVLILGVYNIRFKNKETLELFNLVDEAAEKEALSQSIRTMQNTAREDIKAFNEIVPSSGKLIPLIENLETSGRALGLDVEILSVEEVKNTDSLGLQNIRIAIETQGSWPSTLSFLRVIESLPHRVLIDESSISKQGDLWRSRIILSLHLFD
jgi:Tfp pilus assembly protein PilO